MDLLDAGRGLTRGRRGLLEEPADDARAVAVRRVAVAALGRNAHARAEALIASTVADADPGVRIAAVEALADRPALAGIYKAARKQAWSEQRAIRVAAAALAAMSTARRAPRSSPGPRRCQTRPAAMSAVIQ